MFDICSVKDDQASFLENQRKNIANDLQKLRNKASRMEDVKDKYDRSRRRLHILINILSAIKYICYMLCIITVGLQNIFKEPYLYSSVLLLLPFLTGYSLHLMREIVLYQFRCVSDVFYDIGYECSIMNHQIKLMEGQHFSFSIKLLMKARHFRIQKERFQDSSY